MGSHRRGVAYSEYAALACTRPGESKTPSTYEALTRSDLAYMCKGRFDQATIFDKMSESWQLHCSQRQCGCEVTYSALDTHHRYATFHSRYENLLMSELSKPGLALVE